MASCSGYVSLGQGGSIVLRFDSPVLLASGSSQPDIHIFEIGSAVEAFRLEISNDQVTWIDIGVVSGQPSSVDIDANPAVSPGDQFAFVRLTDVSNSNNGADIDAVGVNPTYPPPEADAGPDQAVASSSLVTLDGTASSSAVAGVLIDFEWTQLSGPAITLSDETSPQPSFMAPSIALGGADQTLVFQLIVTDDLGQSSASDTVSITVNAPNDTPPTADAGADQSVASAALVRLDGSNSSDPDAGDTITYAWRQVSGAAVTLDDPSSPQPSFTAPTLLVTDTPITLVFELVVTDSLLAPSSPDRVTITVNPPGDTPPTAVIAAPVSAMASTTVVLDGSQSSDPDPDDTLTYKWRQIAGPSVDLINADADRAEFVAPPLAPGDDAVTLVFELVVTDSQGRESLAQRIAINISAPQALSPQPVPLGPWTTLLLMASLMLLGLSDARQRVRAR